MDQNRKGFVCGVPGALYLMIHIYIWLMLRNENVHVVSTNVGSGQIDV